MPAVADTPSSLADLLRDAPATLLASELGRRLGVSRSAVSDWSRCGLLPPPTGLGVRPRWSRDVVIQWLRKLEAAAERRS